MAGCRTTCVELQMFLCRRPQKRASHLRHRNTARTPTRRATDVWGDRAATSTSRLLVVRKFGQRGIFCGNEGVHACSCPPSRGSTASPINEELRGVNPVNPHWSLEAQTSPTDGSSFIQTLLRKIRRELTETTVGRKAQKGLKTGKTKMAAVHDEERERSSI